MRIGIHKGTIILTTTRMEAVDLLPQLALHQRDETAWSRGFSTCSLVIWAEVGTLSESGYPKP